MSNFTLAVTARRAHDRALTWEHQDRQRLAGHRPQGEQAQEAQQEQARREHARGADAGSYSPASPPPNPVTIADAFCPPAGEMASFGGSRRFAQTFTALRSGQLTSATIAVADNAEGDDF